jgi:hypothetical protein
LPNSAILKRPARGNLPCRQNMRHLAQPAVLKKAGTAALVTALACYPRLSLWLNRSDPIWYLEAMIFFCSMVLWGFVFAWQTPYTGRPVWVFSLKPGLVVLVTLLGIIVAAAFQRFVDPLLRVRAPEEFPTDLKHWFALLLFSLFLNQLFVLFAPFAWLMRLFKNRGVAMVLTAFFGVVVLAIKVRSFPVPIPMTLWAALLAGRLVTGLVGVAIYLRGGIILVWWWTLLLEARYLVNLAKFS